jgi:hypothetical protein
MGSHPTLAQQDGVAEALELDHRGWRNAHTHKVREAEAEAERAFDRLNPDFGVPADQRSPYGLQAVRDREAALALGVRAAVHDSRQNDRNPVIWQPGQDYRAADAIQAARRHPTRARWGPERLGPER